MEIIGAGFGRTGTSSLKLALEQLGYGPCYHMNEVEPQGHVHQWAEIERTRLERGRADPQKLEDVFRGYQATVDWPGCRYWRELADLFPDAKVLLSVRDFDSWHASAQNTIYRYDQEVQQKYDRFPWLKLLRWRDYEWRHLREMLWGETGDFEGRFEDKEAARVIYERHIEAVKAAIPPERLLVYEVKQGWTPLCEFLGVDLPNTPFPRTNVGGMAESWKVIESADYACIGLPVVALAGAAIWGFLRAQRSGKF